MFDLIRFLGKPFGLRFAPDTHIIPILRADQYHRFRGPGYFFINPLLEKTLPPISIGVRVEKFTVCHVVSHDQISFTFQEITILFKFEPGLLSQENASQMIRQASNSELLRSIVEDFVSQGLHRFAASFSAEELIGETTRLAIERGLSNHLKEALSVLGLRILPKDGVLLKEIIPPYEYKNTMLEAKRREATQRALDPISGAKLTEPAIFDALTRLGDEGVAVLLSLLFLLSDKNVALSHLPVNSVSRRNDK